MSSVLSDNNNDPPHHLHPVPAVPAVPGGVAVGELPGAGHLLPRAVLGQGEARQPG